MTLRKVTSLTATLSFILMLVTSIILYIVPQGRVAYWTDWHLWGLTKEQWGEVHINVGLLFLLALCLHIYYNWKPLMAYLKDRTKQIKVFTPAFNVALMICLLTVAGTLFMIPPFSWVLSANTALKDAGAKKYGEPPYGHAELSTLGAFAKKVGLDAATARQRLEAAGFNVGGGDQSLKLMAAINHTTPKVLYEAMQKADEAGPAKKKLPDNPPPGTGRLSVAGLCTTYGLDQQELLAALWTKDIDAVATDSLRDIAQRHGMELVDLYDVIKSMADTIEKAG